MTSTTAEAAAVFTAETPTRAFLVPSRGPSTPGSELSLLSPDARCYSSDYYFCYYKTYYKSKFTDPAVERAELATRDVCVGTTSGGVTAPMERPMEPTAASAVVVGTTTTTAPSSAAATKGGDDGQAVSYPRFFRSLSPSCEASSVLTASPPFYTTDSKNCYRSAERNDDGDSRGAAHSDNRRGQVHEMCITSTATGARLLSPSPDVVVVATAVEAVEGELALRSPVASSPCPRKPPAAGTEWAARWPEGTTTTVGAVATVEATVVPTVSVSVPAADVIVPAPPPPALAPAVVAAVAKGPSSSPTRELFPRPAAADGPAAGAPSHERTSSSTRGRSHRRSLAPTQRAPSLPLPAGGSEARRSHRDAAAKETGETSPALVPPPTPVSWPLYRPSARSVSRTTETAASTEKPPPTPPTSTATTTITTAAAESVLQSPVETKRAPLSLPRSHAGVLSAPTPSRVRCDRQPNALCFTEKRKGLVFTPE